VKIPTAIIRITTWYRISKWTKCFLGFHKYRHIVYGWTEGVVRTNITECVYCKKGDVW
jgi:hypothetical protein